VEYCKIICDIQGEIMLVDLVINISRGECDI